MIRPILLSMTCVILFCSCSSTTVIMPKDVSQLHSPQKRTSWSFFWGALEDKKFKDTELTDCQGNGLAAVTVRTNAAFVLLNVVSLGIVMPIRIEFDCATDSH